MTKYVIYQHKNKTTGKSYVGFTKETIDVRWKQHIKMSRIKQNKFYNAINKYGVDDWEHIILVDTVPAFFKNEFERYWIEHLDSYKNGYNSTIGGEGGRDTPLSQDTKDKISKANKGRKLRLTPERKEQLVLQAKTSPWLDRTGKLHSEHSKLLISANNARTKVWLGKTRCKETKDKISKATMGNNSRCSVVKWEIESPNGVICNMSGLSKKEAAEYFGINPKTFRSAATRKTPFTKGPLKGFTIRNI